MPFGIVPYLPAVRPPDAFMVPLLPIPHSSFILHPSSFILHPSSFTPFMVPLTLTDPRSAIPHPGSPPLLCIPSPLNIRQVHSHRFPSALRFALYASPVVLQLPIPPLSRPSNSETASCFTLSALSPQPSALHPPSFIWTATLLLDTHHERSFSLSRLSKSSGLR